MTLLTENSVITFFKENNLNKKNDHSFEIIAEAINLTCENFEFENTVDMLRLILLNVSIDSLHTHSYGFHTADGREIINYFTESYNTIKTSQHEIN